MADNYDHDSLDYGEWLQVPGRGGVVKLMPDLREVLDERQQPVLHLAPLQRWRRVGVREFLLVVGRKEAADQPDHVGGVDVELVEDVHAVAELVVAEQVEGVQRLNVLDPLGLVL